MSSEEKFIVEGIKEDGKVFRPSDWVERISSQLARFGSDHRLHYSSSAQPCIIDGVKCLMVKKSLLAENPEAYESILKFARDNQLRVRDCRRQHDRDESADNLSGAERRLAS